MQQPGSSSNYLASDHVDGACEPERKGGPRCASHLLTALVAVGVGFVAGRRSVAVCGSTTHPASEQAQADEGWELFAHPWEPKLLPIFDQEPIAKNTVRRFDAFLINEAAFEDPETKLINVEQWLAPDFVYETVGFGSSFTPRSWCLDGEEKEFRRTFNSSLANQMLFFGTDTFATTASYLTVFWAKDLKGVPAKLDWTYFRVIDFYSVRATGPGRGLIFYNFMMIDFVDFFQRNGIQMVPRSPLPEGLVLSAAANDGTPAPHSVAASTQDRATAQRVSELALHEDWAGMGTPPPVRQWHPNLTFYGPGGIGVARGTEEYREFVLRPFWEAFAERRVVTNITGCEGDYCGTFGELQGRHVGSWLGQEASGKRLAIRFAFHYRVVGGLVLEGWAIFDVPGLFGQLGKDFFKLAADPGLRDGRVSKNWM